MAQAAALVSVAFAVSVNHGVYNDANLFLAAVASVLLVTAVFLIARAEPRKLIAEAHRGPASCCCIYACAWGIAGRFGRRLCLDRLLSLFE